VKTSYLYRCLPQRTGRTVLLASSPLRKPTPGHPDRSTSPTNGSAGNKSSADSPTSATSPPYRPALLRKTQVTHRNRISEPTGSPSTSPESGCIPMTPRGPGRAGGGTSVHPGIGGRVRPGRVCARTLRGAPFLLGSGCGSERYAAIPASSHAAIDARIRRLSLRFQSHSCGQHVPRARSSSEVACTPPHLVPPPVPRGTD
jgi:hypothetical protein